LIALYEGTREAVWLNTVVSFVGKTSRLTEESQIIPLLEGNEACIAQIPKGFVRSDGTKHIDPKYYNWIAQENGTTVDVRSIPSQENTADIFAKALPAAVHQYHVKGLGLKSPADFGKSAMLRRGIASCCKKM
jgi:hypothetical protein